MKKIYLGLIAMLLLFGSSLYSQVANYTFASTAGTYSPITGGTAIKYGNVVTGSNVAAATLDDDVYYNRPIGFSFVYNGVAYTDFGFNSNGWLIFGNSTTFASTSTPISTAASSNVVSGGAADIIGAIQVIGSLTTGSNVLTVNASSPTSGINIGDSVTGTGIASPGAVVTAVTSTTVTVSVNSTSTTTTGNWKVRNGEIRYETIGTAPNRTLVLQFSNFSRFSSTYPGDRMNFQIRLNETSNTVQVVYGAWSATSTTTTNGLQVGLRGLPVTDYNNRTTTTNWASTTAGASNTANALYSTTVYPASGQTFTWTPAACTSPSVISSANVTTTTATINWNAVAGVPQYEYEVRTSGAAGSGATGLALTGIVGTNNANLSPLTSGTSYSVYVRSLCGAGNNGAWSAAFILSTACVSGTVPYSQNFDAVTAPALPLCIIVEDLNAGNTWATSAVTFTGSTSPNVMRYTYNSTIAANDWFYLQGLSLTAGVQYTLTFRYAGTSYVEKLEVRVGTAPNSVSALAGPQIFNNVNITAAGDGTGTFTPTATGTYYFGFHVFSDADQNSLYVDNVNIVVTPTSAPTCVTNISPANLATNVSAPPTLTWNASPLATSYDVYFGTSIGTMANIGNVAGTSTPISGTAPSTTYYWYVAPKNTVGTATGCETNATSFTTSGGPANDSCGASTALTNNVPLNSTTVFASNSIPPVACAGFTATTPTGDVWFNFVTNAAGNANITVSNAAGSFDPVIVVYSGTPAVGCTGLTSIGCADANAGGGSETASVSGLTQGTTYLVRVYGYAAANANTFTITVTGTALPVTITEFRGEKNGSVNNLTWTTQIESNNSGFELQRSADGVNFSRLNFVASKAIGGNSSSVLTYNFADVTPLPGNNYYRLNQIDRDGSSNLSKIVLIKGARSTKIELISIYPNPATEIITVLVEAPAAASVNLVVTDISGKIVMNESKQLLDGSNNLKLNVGNLAAGSYFIKAYCGSECATAVSKFVKQ